MGLKVYAVLVVDRHTDTEIHIHSNKEAAITFARKTAKEACRSDEDYEEQDIDGWLFCAEYSCEGDYVRVTQESLIGPATFEKEQGT